MYKIELNENDMNLVLQSLGKRPAELVINVILTIKQQCAAQIKPEVKDIKK